MLVNLFSFLFVNVMTLNSTNFPLCSFCPEKLSNDLILNRNFFCSMKKEPSPSSDNSTPETAPVLIRQDERNCLSFYFLAAIDDCGQSASHDQQDQADQKAIAGTRLTCLRDIGISHHDGRGFDDCLS